MIDKKLTFASILTIFILVAGCRVGTEPALTGNMTGFVMLVDSNGNHPADRSGVIVTAQGTSFSTITDSSGKWTIGNLSSGSYTFVETKPGYDMSEQQDIQFVGGDDLDPGTVNGYIIMAQPPNFLVAINSVTKLNDGNLEVGLTISGDIQLSQNELLILIGKDSNVNPSHPNSYLYSDIELFGDVAGFPQEIATSELEESGFKSGMTAYIAVYALCYGTLYASYFDVASGRIAYTSAQSQSKVIQVTIP